jgi:hypothetical protein
MRIRTGLGAGEKGELEQVSIRTVEQQSGGNIEYSFDCAQDKLINKTARNFE